MEQHGCNHSILGSVLLYPVTEIITRGITVLEKIVSPPLIKTQQTAVQAVAVHGPPGVSTASFRRFSGFTGLVLKIRLGFRVRG